MKRLIAILALLFAPVALAVDNPLTCTGASCKINMTPRDGSNVTLTYPSLSVSGATSTTVIKTTAATTTPVLDVQGNNGSGNGGANNGLHVQIDNTSANRWLIQAQSGDTPATKFEVDGNGATNIGSGTASTNQLLTVGGGISLNGAVVSKSSSMYWQQFEVEEGGAADVTVSLATVNLAAAGSASAYCLATTLYAGATSGSSGGSRHGAFNNTITCGNASGIASPYCSQLSAVDVANGTGTGAPTLSSVAAGTSIATLKYTCPSGGGAQYVHCFVDLKCTVKDGATITNLFNP